MEFLDWCHKNKILVAVFPPHSIHRLQPLDVSLFSPLAKYYSRELDYHIAYSQGLVSVGKRHFWRFFWAAYNHAFTPDNIASGWKKTGIHPFNPDAVLGRLPKRTRKESPLPKTRLQTIQPLQPNDRTSMRNLLNAVVGRTTREELQLRSTFWDMQVNNGLLTEEVNGLKAALCDKNNKQAKSKGLFDELRDAGEGNFLFLSPAKVQQARDLKTKRKQAKIDEQRAIEERKVQRVIAKENRLRIEAEKRAARLADQARRAAEKAAKKAEQQQAREDREVVRQLRQAAKAVKRTPKKKSNKVFGQEVQSTEVVEAEELTATPPPRHTRTRKINLPQRLKDYEL